MEVLGRQIGTVFNVKTNNNATELISYAVCLLTVSRARPLLSIKQGELIMIDQSYNAYNLPCGDVSAWGFVLSAGKKVHEGTAGSRYSFFLTSSKSSLLGSAMKVGTSTGFGRQSDAFLESNTYAGSSVVYKYIGCVQTSLLASRMRHPRSTSYIDSARR